MTITAKELREATLRGEGPLAKAHDDEPVFLLRGQDNLAADFVEKWSIHAGLLVPSVDIDSAMAKKVSEAKAIAEAMRAWPIRKDPD